MFPRSGPDYVNGAQPIDKSFERRHVTMSPIGRTAPRREVALASASYRLLEQDRHSVSFIVTFKESNLQELRDV